MLSSPKIRKRKPNRTLALQDTKPLQLTPTKELRDRSNRNNRSTRNNGSKWGTEGKIGKIGDLGRAGNTYSDHLPEDKKRNRNVK